MSENSYYVYRHKTPNNLIYIGITMQEPEKRWNNGTGYREQYFYKAIKQFGWNNIEHKILAHGLTEKQAKNLEIKLIAHYKSNDKKYGYNKTNGGDYFNTACYSSIKVICVDTDKVYDSMAEASKDTGATSSKISMCCNGERGSAGGYKWIKLEDWNNLSKDEKINIKNKDIYYKCVFKYVIEINSGKIFKNIKQASKFYKIKTGYISRNCVGITKYISNGLKFMFLEDWNRLTNIEKQKLKEKKYISNNDKKRVKCITTGQIFSSVQETADYFNIKRQAIRDYCRKLVKNKNGLEFEFIDI